MSEDELLDLVDDEDRVIGTVLRSATMARKLRHFRVINAFIRNSRGELWIPRRSAGKRIFPLCLDVSVGGHVGAGESYELAFERETAEEVNLRLADVPWRHLGSMTPVQHGVSAFMQVYEICCDAAPDYNREDFSGYWWLTPTRLMEWLRSGEPAKEDLPRLVAQFYS